MNDLKETCAALDDAKLKMETALLAKLVDGDTDKQAIIAALCNLSFVTGAAKFAQFLRDGYSVDNFIKKYAEV